MAVDYILMESGHAKSGSDLQATTDAISCDATFCQITLAYCYRRRWLISVVFRRFQSLQKMSHVAVLHAYQVSSAEFPQMTAQHAYAYAMQQV